MSSTFFIPAVNIMGNGCLDEAMVAIRNYGFRKALIVTDAGLAKAGVARMIAEKLAMQDIDSVLYDGAKPNPNVENVENGLALLAGQWLRGRISAALFRQCFFIGLFALGLHSAVKPWLG